MDKRTILAIVLSVAVMIAFFAIQSIFFPPSVPSPASTQQTGSQEQVSQGVAAPQPASDSLSLGEIASPETPVEKSPVEEAPAEIIPLENVTIETDIIKVVLSNAGGNVISFQLKNHNDGNMPVEMIFSGSSTPGAFAVAFGNLNDVITERIRPVNLNFKVNRISNYIVEFSQVFSASSGSNFTMTKRYEFKPGEYLFELTIVLDSGYNAGPYNFGGSAYTLAFGPQIGPKFEKLDQRYEYRRYLTYKGKMKTEKVSDKEPLIISSQPSWAAIAGKYFTFIAMPYTNQYELAFSTRAESGIPSASRLFISRPSSGSSRLEDKYHFYLGPKNQETLNIYDRGDNGFKLRDTGLIEVANTRGFLAPLEKVLKWLLQLFHKIIPNYGIAIILVTLIVKLIMFPITKKGSESTMRMQALSPKIKEIQEKYKDNPQKMNAEMAEFYKKEGYNPLSGCLPMIIQIPIFFAMYNLFNNHFDLRGAEFIPVWITDLSRPESIYNFPNNFRLPLLGWTAIRVLPFLYVGSQLLYGKVTQTPDQKGNAQMKMMLYAMPIVFFFILYDVPSGLLIYWIMSNVLTMAQQVIINKYMAKKKAAMPQPEQKPVIAPPPGGGKKKKKK